MFQVIEAQIPGRVNAGRLIVHPNVIMYVGLSGYQTFWRFLTPITSDLNLEIELKR